jgi:hypothetical protein
LFERAVEVDQCLQLVEHFELKSLFWQESYRSGEDPFSLMQAVLIYQLAVLVDVLICWCVVMCWCDVVSIVLICVDCEDSVPTNLESVSLPFPTEHRAFENPLNWKDNLNRFVYNAKNAQRKP